MSGVGLIIAAGGSSVRFGTDKLFQEINGLPLILYSIRTLSPLADECVVVTQVPERVRDVMRTCGLDAGKLQFAPNGETRQQSVENGLRQLSRNIEIVAVQDGARPLTTADLFLRCVEAARMHGSGVAAHRVTDTIKIAQEDGTVLETPERSMLWAAETPQVFRRDWLENGYRFCREKGIAVTDDAEAVQRAGYPVRLVENTARNIKITHPGDLKMLSFLLGG